MHRNLKNNLRCLHNDGNGQCTCAKGGTHQQLFFSPSIEDYLTKTLAGIMSLGNSIVQRALITYHDLSMATKAALAISIALVLYRFLFRHESTRRKELPAWGPIEMGLVMYLLDGAHNSMVYRI